jgi:hypothetical protein
LTPNEYTFVGVWVVPEVGVLLLVNGLDKSTRTLVAYLIKEPIIIKRKRQLEEA